MDIGIDEKKCGSCADWKGKRDVQDDGKVSVKASAKGQCERLKKVKPPHGGCGEWTKMEGTP